MKNNSGFSIVQVLVLMTALLLTTIGLFDMLGGLWAGNNQLNLNSTVTQIRLAILANIANPVSWTKTIQANPVMRCAIASNAKSPFNVLPYTAPGYINSCLTTVPATWNEITIVGTEWTFANSTAATVALGRPLTFAPTYRNPGVPPGWITSVPMGFDPAAQGYDVGGMPCGTFTTPFGNPLCPLQVHVFWTVDCGSMLPAECNNILPLAYPNHALQDRIRIKFLFPPKAAWVLGAPILNPERLRFPSNNNWNERDEDLTAAPPRPLTDPTVDATYRAGKIRIEIGVKTAEVQCGLEGGKYVGHKTLGYRTAPNSKLATYPADSRGCVPAVAFE